MGFSKCVRRVERQGKGKMSIGTKLSKTYSSISSIKYVSFNTKKIYMSDDTFGL